MSAPFLAVALCGVVTALPSVALNVVERYLGPGQRFVPGVTVAQTWLGYVALVSIPVGLTSTWVSSRAALEAATWRVRVIWGLGLAGLVAVLCGLAMVGWVMTKTDWIFGAPAPYASERSPDGKRTAYATVDCFLSCRFTVHVREGGALVMGEVVNESGYDRAAPPRLRWSADSHTVQLVP